MEVHYLKYKVALCRKNNVQINLFTLPSQLTILVDLVF